MNRKKTGKLYVILVILAVATVVSVSCCVATRRNVTLKSSVLQPVIKNGIEYNLISFGSSKAKLTGGREISAYCITFSYPVENRKSIPAGKTIAVSKNARPVLNKTGTTCSVETRTTVQVPTEMLSCDKNLSIGKIVWDPPVVVEGQTYRTVRWHPRSKVATNRVPLLRERMP